jgi:hypothetical protein
MWFRNSDEVKLSPHLRDLWGFIPIRFLILATPGFIVFLEKSLDVNWKTTPGWDSQHPKEREKHSAVLNRAAIIESDEWDDSNPQKTLNLRRQIGEAIARCFCEDYISADQMLDRAECYRLSMLAHARRKKAVQEHVTIKRRWESSYKRWAFTHYTVGILALVFSTLVAAKPTLLGLNENSIGLFAWLVAVFTSLLTFLSPDKKASKYMRAWSILNSQIIRNNTDQNVTVEDVLDAYQQGQNIIFETNERGKGRGR